MRKAAFLLPITLLSAYATIVNGSSQTVTVSGLFNAMKRRAF